MDNVAKIAEDSSESSEPKPFVFDQIQEITENFGFSDTGRD